MPSLDGFTSWRPVTWRRERAPGLHPAKSFNFSGATRRGSPIWTLSRCRSLFPILGACLGLVERCQLRIPVSLGQRGPGRQNRGDGQVSIHCAGAAPWRSGRRGHCGNPYAVEVDVGIPLRVCLDRIQPFGSQRDGGGGPGTCSDAALGECFNFGVVGREKFEL